MAASGGTRMPQGRFQGCALEGPGDKMAFIWPILQMVLGDLQKHQYQAQAREFTDSQGFELLCDWLRRETKAIPKAANEGEVPQCKWRA